MSNETNLTKVNLTELGHYTIYNVDDLSETEISNLEELGYDLEDCDAVWVNNSDLEDADISAYPEDWEFDKYDAEEELSYYLPKAESGHYLVLACGVRWNGANGYSIVDNVLDTIYRSYENTVYLKEVKNDVATCSEYSHDVPMGNTTYIVALTDKEYEQVKEWLEYGKFELIHNFVFNKKG